MNFLQTGRISLLSVALNIITCLPCGVLRKISCTSFLMSANNEKPLVRQHINKSPHCLTVPKMDFSTCALCYIAKQNSKVASGHKLDVGLKQTKDLLSHYLVMSKNIGSLVKPGNGKKKIFPCTRSVSQMMRKKRKKKEGIKGSYQGALTSCHIHQG